MKKWLPVTLLVLAAGVVYIAWNMMEEPEQAKERARPAAIADSASGPAGSSGSAAKRGENSGESGNSTSSSGPQAAGGGMEALPAELRLVEAFGQATFDTPVGIRHAGDGSGRLFIVEKKGTIAVIHPNADQPGRGVFLDIRDNVLSGGSEQGLLGLAFHPDYADNGKFYVNYTDLNGDTVVAEYAADRRDRNRADAASGRVLLKIGQPYSNHNGGDMAFGPDGYLYIATGDGGSGGDPQGYAQNRKSLLGKILRLDVDGRSADLPYAIPADNPFYGNKEGYREEIYAYGLRNPWRISFDRETGELWAADVGQSDVEEIDVITAGGNYGWNRMEGSTCFKARECDRDGLVMPVWEYAPEGRGASITGGYVYRGDAIPALRGWYVFADFMDGRMWTLLPGDGTEPRVALLEMRVPGITSFGEDEAGELFATLFDGKVMRLVASSGDPS